MKSWEIERIHHEEGRKEGICALISTLQEMHVSRADTIAQLMQKLSLSQADAEKYMHLYWK